MYESLILIDAESSISAARLADELRSFYQDNPEAPDGIDLEMEVIVLRWPDYEMRVSRSCVPHVLEESADIAEKWGRSHPSRLRIAACACRFELSGDDDPDMDRFNDSLFIGEALERLGRVYRFDQSSGEFLE